jgi:hypothetical protein
MLLLQKHLKGMFVTVLLIVFIFVCFYRVETQVFKSKFDAWDDVLAVDFTRTAENVSRKGADMKVSMK